MPNLTTTELANHLGVSKGRVSQYVSEGKLDGCYSGDGRARRFDLARVANALGRVLDKGQMLGNGADTRKAISEIVENNQSKQIRDDARRTGAGATELLTNDPDRYEMARTLKAEEEARSLRRRNELEEGNYVLASEVERNVAKILAQEIAEFEVVLRDGSRMVADRLGVDFKAVRKIMVDAWRDHRTKRSVVLGHQADASEMSDVERDADI
ncbi:hypothetical protein [Paenirhodobacter sp. CAU 1674]|uniref:hypothetical protein n=1 Tax=Paenirhodobacter sp. CAU 1674 TaxID=3032596 RepID=UPI0023D9F028|nr:hypothetical protein [Paenirhodobacter sp. CAU 1674]MDF2140848.1 hypothetical protein [Paenirhodobacter sp. CAU 1674]